MSSVPLHGPLLTVYTTLISKIACSGSATSNMLQTSEGRSNIPQVNRESAKSHIMTCVCEKGIPRSLIPRMSLHKLVNTS